jgi:hypothetical protein
MDTSKDMKERNMGDRKSKQRKAGDSEKSMNGQKKSSEATDSKWSAFKHFVPREFTCKCSGLCSHEDVVSAELVLKLERIRDLIGKPVVIRSGTRCESHNRQVGGMPGSAHIPLNGMSHAADILCPDSAFRFAFLTAALPMFNRIGIGPDFVHVDDSPHLQENQVWLYNGKAAVPQVKA